MKQLEVYGDQVMAKGYCQSPSYEKCLAMCVKYAVMKGKNPIEAENECVEKCWKRWCIEIE